MPAPNMTNEQNSKLQITAAPPRVEQDDDVQRPVRGGPVCGSEEEGTISGLREVPAGYLRLPPVVRPDGVQLVRPVDRRAAGKGR